MDINDPGSIDKRKNLVLMSQRSSIPFSSPKFFYLLPAQFV